MDSHVYIPTCVLVGAKEAADACEMLIDNIRFTHSCVDEYLADQLIIFMALAKGRL